MTWLPRMSRYAPGKDVGAGKTVAVAAPPPRQARGRLPVELDGADRDPQHQLRGSRAAGHQVAPWASLKGKVCAVALELLGDGALMWWFGTRCLAFCAKFKRLAPAIIDQQHRWRAAAFRPQPEVGVDLAGFAHN